jgi:hypothetical protein
MSNYNDIVQEIADLENELLILTAKRSIRPNMHDQARMRMIFARLFEITEDEKYKI